MFRLVKQLHFDSAHSLPDYDGKCAMLHGHRWNVTVVIIAHVLDDKGMVFDFTKLKQIADEYDHRILNEVVPNPTAELIASDLFVNIREYLSEDIHDELVVSVQESPWFSD